MIAPAEPVSGSADEPAGARALQSRLDPVFAAIAASAGDRDRIRVPPFPADAIDALERAGVLAWNAQVGTRRPPAAAELNLVRATARADASVGRILDGHLNAVERLAVQAPPELREREFDAIRHHRLRAGVWGGDPRPGEGPPATVITGTGGPVLRGVKTFCSGAGGLDRALVVARRPEPGPPLSVWIDLTDPARVEVDESWYRGSGLRASVSHRVIFHDAPVLAQFGPAGALSAQPWFARDALRTAASWAGMVDAALDAALSELAGRSGAGALEDLAAGRMLSERRTVRVWLSAAARAMDRAGTDAGSAVELVSVSVHARAAIADAARRLLDEAARACGSHPFACAAPLDRARRDLELFLLQHRLEPMLAKAGHAALVERSG